MDFTNSHSLYPTVTTVNASAIATGHYIGDTGDFGNTLYAGRPMNSLQRPPVGFLENNTVLAEMNRKFGGNYLDETTLMAAARAKGWQTAVIGKEGPAAHPGFHRRAGRQRDPDPGRRHRPAMAGLGLPDWFSRAMSAGLRRRRGARRRRCPTSSRKSG